MNERIRLFAKDFLFHEQFTSYGESIQDDRYEFYPDELQEFIKLIVEECRTIVNDLYHKTPLELCGPLLTADDEIAKHFYGDAHERKD
jgi:hypothetical protein